MPCENGILPTDNECAISIVIKQGANRADCRIVIKTLMILVLAVGLLTAAFLTRPDKRQFMLHLLDQQSRDGQWSSQQIDRAQSMAKEVTVKDRWLWTDVERDGKVIYSGLFAHWVPRGEKMTVSVPAMGDLVKLAGK